MANTDIKTDETAGKTDETHKPKHSFKKLYVILILILFLVFFTLFVTPRKDEIIGDIQSRISPVTTITNKNEINNVMYNVSTPVVQAMSVVLEIMPIMVVLAVIMAVIGLVMGGPRK